jgi:hypothetical protein
LSASSFASDDPPGSPRLPCARAQSTDRHVPPGASGIGPESYFGHRRVRRKAAAWARCVAVARGIT